MKRLIKVGANCNNNKAEVFNEVNSMLDMHRCFFMVTTGPVESSGLLHKPLSVIPLIYSVFTTTLFLALRARMTQLFFLTDINKPRYQNKLFHCWRRTPGLDKLTFPSDMTSLCVCLLMSLCLQNTGSHNASPFNGCAVFSIFFFMSHLICCIILFTCF